MALDTIRVRGAREHNLKNVSAQIVTGWRVLRERAGKRKRATSEQGQLRILINAFNIERHDARHHAALRIPQLFHKPSTFLTLIFGPLSPAKTVQIEKRDEDCGPRGRHRRAYGRARVASNGWISSIKHVHRDFCYVERSLSYSERYLCCVPQTLGSVKDKPPVTGRATSKVSATSSAHDKTKGFTVLCEEPSEIGFMELFKCFKVRCCTAVVASEIRFLKSKLQDSRAKAASQHPHKCSSCARAWNMAPAPKHLEQLRGGQLKIARRFGRFITDIARSLWGFNHPATPLPAQPSRP